MQSADADAKWIWVPDANAIPRTNVFRFMERLGFRDREDFLRYSREYPESFWDAMVRELSIHWFEPYTKVMDSSAGPEWTKWFIGGKLNIAWNCLDRHANLSRPAVLWEAENGSSGEISFTELHAEVNRFANGLAGLGLAAGDRVAICMPMCPEIVTAIYACLKLGAIVVPVFAGFGTRAIATRIAHSGAKFVLTADFLERRGKKIPLKDKVDEALASAPDAVKTIVLRYRGGDVHWDKERDIWWNEVIDRQPATYESMALDSESIAFILYTSGTTGTPKGAIHTHAGSLAQTAKEVYLAFDHQPQDRFFWLTDIGWMMGPWSILGNHNFGGTIFLYDGAPDYPDPNRLWQVVERHRITTLGISPTAIRVLMRHSDPRRFQFEPLRLLGSTGEPWDEPSYRWFFTEVGGARCPIINISGGTEIIGCFLLPLPIQPLKPCSLGAPSPGMAAEVVDESGQPVRGKQGYLVCTKPAPSMTRGLWHDPERYLNAYWLRFPGWWNHGDWATVDEDGCWFLHGRADESMNVAGRKVGPAEIEEALIEHSSVAEAAVIGVPDDITGEAIVAFIVPKPGIHLTDALTGEICDQVAESMGRAFRPKVIQAVPELPKTQSGKIMRRVIRQKFLGEPLGDVSTIESLSTLRWFEPTLRTAG